MKEQPYPKAICELDGQEIELIVHELEKGVAQARIEQEKQHAKLLELVISKLVAEKKKFHKNWSDYFLQKEKTHRFRDQ